MSIFFTKQFMQYILSTYSVHAVHQSVHAVHKYTVPCDHITALLDHSIAHWPLPQPEQQPLGILYRNLAAAHLCMHNGCKIQPRRCVMNECVACIARHMHGLVRRGLHIALVITVLCITLGTSVQCRRGKRRSTGAATNSRAMVGRAWGLPCVGPAPTGCAVSRLLCKRTYAGLWLLLGPLECAPSDP